jgi:hypothetical protein
LAPFEVKIREAWTDLHQMHANKKSPSFDTYKTQFMDSCSADACADATNGLLAVISNEASVF